MNGQAVHLNTGALNKTIDVDESQHETLHAALGILVNPVRHR